LFKVECIIWLSMLNATLLVNTMSKALNFIKFNNRFLLYNCNNPWNIHFKVKILPIPTPLIKNKCIGIFKYIYSIYNIAKYLFISSLNCVKIHYHKIWWCCETITFNFLGVFIEYITWLNDEIIFKSYFSMFNVLVWGLKDACHQCHHSICFVNVNILILKYW